MFLTGGAGQVESIQFICPSVQASRASWEQVVGLKFGGVMLPLKSACGSVLESETFYPDPIFAQSDDQTASKRLHGQIFASFLTRQ